MTLLQIYRLNVANKESKAPFRKHIKTITTDNGSEFCCHEYISRFLSQSPKHKPYNIVYFADSFCSWQKGAIENTNKLIRQYIPKGTDFSKITDS